MMADIVSPLRESHNMANTGGPIDNAKHPEKNKPRLPPMSIPMPIPGARNGQISLDVFSPVNQNGSFEFDRVLKSGHVYKRSRKTKQWKKFFLVLRPNLLSMYKNESEVKLLKQVNLSELTAINILKDPKGRREHMFGLFTPSHNYHFQAGSEMEARSWVDLIRKEARIDEEEQSMVFGSPPTLDGGFQNFAQSIDTNIEPGRIFDRLASSSPEPTEALPQAASTTSITAPQPIFSTKPYISRPRQQSLNEFDYSGQEQGSYSDFSDTATQSLPRSSYNPSRTIPIRPAPNRTGSYTSTHAATSIPTSQPFHISNQSEAQSQPQPQHNSHRQEAATTTNTTTTNDNQRVIWQGYLLCLKSKGGVRQWKRLWAVLRPAHLAFYKNEEEYSTHLLLPLSTILSAIEIDPLSRSKAHCMQIISEDKNYRFCAESEEQLLRCLGAVKSLLAKKKAATAASSSTANTTTTASAASTQPTQASQTTTNINTTGSGIGSGVGAATTGPSSSATTGLTNGTNAMNISTNTNTNMNTTNSSGGGTGISTGTSTGNAAM